MHLDDKQINKNIRSIISIVDTRNDDTDEQYDNWWGGKMDDCFLINYMFELVEEMMTEKEHNDFSEWCLKATSDDVLNYIEKFIKEDKQ